MAPAPAKLIDASRPAEFLRDLSEGELRAIKGAIVKELSRRGSARSARARLLVAAVRDGATFDEAAARYNVSRSAVAGAVDRAGGVAALRPLKG